MPSEQVETLKRELTWLAARVAQSAPRSDERSAGFALLGAARFTRRMNRSAISRGRDPSWVPVALELLGEMPELEPLLELRRNVFLWSADVPEELQREIGDFMQGVQVGSRGYTPRL